MHSVLVVDDDSKLRKTLCDILRLKGYETLAAGDGAEAIAAAQRTFVNVALIDLKLPDMSGLEVMARIKSIAPLSEAIILTGHAALDSAIEATNKGAFSYLLKPYDLDVLLMHIHHAVDRQRGQQEILRLASFPEMSPYPVLEVNAAGEITYLNPAAQNVFPELAMSRPVQDKLGDLRSGVAGRETVGRELRVGNTTFEQFLYAVPDSDLLRIYMLNITERKEGEVKINRLNHQLLALRNIAEYFLIPRAEVALCQFSCEALIGIEGIVGAIISICESELSSHPVAWGGMDEAQAAALLKQDTPPESSVGRLEESMPIVVADIQNDTRTLINQEVAQVLDVKSTAQIPLVVGDCTLGSLAVYSSQTDTFDTEAVNFLLEVARNIALGVHTMRLDNRLRATLDSLRKSLDGTVETIANMLELRDPYTAGHERRVAHLTRAIGVEMKLPERQLEGLRVIGYLHDIGKIAVPAEILSKPARLTEIEMLLIKGHAQTGYDILKNLEFPWPVAQAVLQHHERLDGSGYPQGLKDENIILEARILMVADVVEAMASHRPYRAAIGLKTALAEISANSDRFYDRHVVDACIRLFTQQGYQLGSVF